MNNADIEHFIQSVPYEVQYFGMKNGLASVGFVLKDRCFCKGYGKTLRDAVENAVKNLKDGITQ